LTSIKKIVSISLLLSAIALTSRGAGDTLQHRFTGYLIAKSDRKPIPAATISLLSTGKKFFSNTNGKFLVPATSPGRYRIRIQGMGYDNIVKDITIPGTDTLFLSETETELDKIVVTAVAGQSKIRSTPISIAVVSQKELSRNNGTNIIDMLAKAVPGLSAITTGPNISKPFIRGLGYNRVLTMYDGLRQEGQQWGDEHGIEIDPYSIARAEIVKGPASLLYGSDAMAGVLNLIPALPAINDGKIHGDVVSEYQSNNNLVAGSLSLQYRKQQFFWTTRASAKSAGNYRNAVDHYVYNTGFKEINLLAMAGWESAHTKNRIHLTYYNDLQEIPDGSRDSLTRAFTYQDKDAPFDDIRNRPIVPANRLSARSITALHQHIQHFRLYHKGDFHFGKDELSTLLGFQQNNRREYNHPTAPSQAGLFVRLNTINYEASYHFREWIGIDLVYGINGMYQENRNKNATDFPIPDYTLFDIGSYLLVKKEISKTVITAGLRFDSRQINWHDFYTRNDITTGFQKQVQEPDTAQATLSFPAFKRHFSGLSGSIGAVYRFSNMITLKVNTASGYRSPSIPEIGSNGLDPGAHIYYIGNRNAKPEFNWQSDIGLFLSFPGIDVSLEVFHNRINNYIFFQKLYNANGQPVEMVPGNFTYQYRQGSAEIFGAEASWNIHPKTLPWLTLQQQISSINGINTDKESLKLTGEAGKFLPLIPPFKTNTSLRFTLLQKNRVLKDCFFQTEAETAATQNRFYAVDNTETATAGYTLFHVSAGLSIFSSKEKKVCSVLINANNIFNVAYQSHQNRLKYFEYYRQSPDARSGIYNMGRNFSIKVIVNW